MAASEHSSSQNLNLADRPVWRNATGRNGSEAAIGEAPERLLGSVWKRPFMCPTRGRQAAGCQTVQWICRRLVHPTARVGLVRCLFSFRWLFPLRHCVRELWYEPQEIDPKSIV